MAGTECVGRRRTGPSRLSAVSPGLQPLPGSRFSSGVMGAGLCNSAHLSSLLVPPPVFKAVGGAVSPDAQELMQNGMRCLCSGRRSQPRPRGRGWARFLYLGRGRRGRSSWRGTLSGERSLWKWKSTARKPSRF